MPQNAPNLKSQGSRHDLFWAILSTWTPGAIYIYEKHLCHLCFILEGHFQSVVFCLSLYFSLSLTVVSLMPRACHMNTNRPCRYCRLLLAHDVNEFLFSLSFHLILLPVLACQASFVSRRQQQNGGKAEVEKCVRESCINTIVKNVCQGWIWTVVFMTDPIWRVSPFSHPFRR